MINNWEPSAHLATAKTCPQSVGPDEVHSSAGPRSKNDEFRGSDAMALATLDTQGDGFRVDCLNCT